MIVYLLPIGRDRFELYSEAPEDPGAPPGPTAGRMRRWAHQAHVRWHDLVDTARRSTSTSRIARWRHALIARLAESIAEQRTLWALGQHGQATLLFPALLTASDARAALDRALGAALRHHGIWFAVDLPLFLVTGVLAPIPGPNVVAYYLAFRLVGHWLSWRGARRASTRIAWTLEPDASLAELASLLTLPHAARASRVDAIATRLKLHRLSAFLERVTV